MRQQDKLFELIKVLNEGEKQWILKCLKAFKQKNNYTLFKYLDGEEAYNKNRLITALRKTPFINYLPVQKNSLYNAILKFLKSYSDEKSEKVDLKQNISDFTYLDDRLISSKPIEEITSLKEKSIDQQEHLQLLQLLNMEMDTFAENPLANSFKDIDNIYNQYCKNLDLLKEIWDYKLYITKINTLRHGIQIPSEQKAALFSEIKSIISTNNTPKSEIVKYYHNQLNLLYNIHLENFDKAFEISSQQINYYDKYDLPSLKFQKEKAINMVNGVALSFFTDVEDSVVDRLIEKTHLLLENEVFLPFHSILYNKLYYNQLNHYNFRDQEIKRQNLVNEILSKTDKHLFKVSPNLSLSLAYYFFSNKNFDKAITWNNNILNAPKSISYPTAQYNAIILKMLIHIEKGDVFYLKSILNSIKRFVSKDAFSNEFNNSIYLFFKKYENELLSPFPNTTLLCKRFYDLISQQKIENKKNLRFIDIAGWLKKNKL